MWPYASLTCIGSSISLTPLVLKVHFWDYTGSLDNPNMDIRSRFTNYHSYFRNRSTFQISSPISHISITRPSHQWINDSDLANREWDMYHLWIDNGCKISIVNGHSSSAGNLIPSRRTNDYPLMLRWVIPWEMRCRQHQSIMHQQKTFPSGRNGSVRVDALRQSRQRHPGGRLLRARRQYNASRCISPSDRGFAVSSRSVGIQL